ncbi:MAG: FMN-binding protein [Oscillospiraceae bacterium]|jgi:electron transport complex protein RnfG|nr:FMN-binding protein [Oscillospiraceae bacterium]
MSKELLAPVAALTLICLVISAALAVTNSVTAPVIAAAARTRAEAAQKEVLPEADEFESVQSDALPEGVTEAYAAVNGAGYVFMLLTSGYGGDISIIAGIDGEGRITAVKTLSHSETEGLGAKITTPEFLGQFAGSVEAGGADAISGATISSKAFFAAIDDAFAAYEILKEGRT